jgi:ankyrin repeat protein
LLIALAWNIPAFCGEIHDAAKNGGLAKVQALLKGNPDLVFSKDDAYGATPLHWATAFGHKDVAELLLANNAEVNAKAKNGMTPLHWAALDSIDEHATPKMGRKNVAELLLANKADVNSKDNRGMTPLHYAAERGYKDKDIAELLLANKADVNCKDNGGITPLHDAAGHGYKDISELLLAGKAEVNARDNNGETPLHWAAGGGYKDVAQLLLADGAEVNARDRSGNTPLHRAMVRGHKSVVELLLANRANGDATNNNGQTPSQMAALYGRKEDEDVVVGCLSKAASGGDFVLSNAKYPKGILVTSRADLSANVGHVVTLAGRLGMVPKDDRGGKVVVGDHGQITTSNWSQLFTANTVTHVGGACRAGGAR